MLNATVLAKQQGMSVRDYLRLVRGELKLRIPYPDNPRYELRGQYEPGRNGKVRLYWQPWYLGKHAQQAPFPVHEVHKSTNPAEVAGDLADLLR